MSETASAEPRDHGSGSVWPILLGLATVLFILAAVSVFVGRVIDGRAEAARAWPTMDGVVTLSKASVVEYWDSKDRQHRKRDKLDFAYRYTVAGRSYEASAFDPSGAWPPVSVPGFAAEHPVGSHVLVHYDPENPGHAGLSVEGPGQSGGFLIVAFGCGALGLVFAGFGVRSLVRRRSDSTVEAA